MIVELKHATVARAGIPILQDISLAIRPGDRIMLTGENGAGKSSLLLLLAGKLNPFNNIGERRYGWEDVLDFRLARRQLAIVSREEQLRLRQIHGKSTVHEFLLGHADGQDFLYREDRAADREQVERALVYWQIGHLEGNLLAKLSLGEMRLVEIARASLHPRRLYLLDEAFSSLSQDRVSLLISWIQSLPQSAAVVLTSHDEEVRRYFAPNRVLRVANARLHEMSELPQQEPLTAKPLPVAGRGQDALLVHCEHADFFHDFSQVLSGVSFALRSGDRVLLTGLNGSGKTTLLRVIHGDFYPAWQRGHIEFLGPLAHDQKAELWNRVQLVAAAHFDYYPTEMTVETVLATRLSGSLYSYAQGLPDDALKVAEQFGLLAFLPRRFARLSEGEKTRVLLARAFLRPAAVYLIDEGFMALSRQYFDLTTDFLNQLPENAVVIIAANERVNALQERLAFGLQRWHMERGQLAILP